jgi:outer membrane receptor for ferric coprogen and ferric-rhodotorulic acid
MTLPSPSTRPPTPHRRYHQSRLLGHSGPIINYAKPANYRYQRSEKGLYAATRLRATDALSAITGSRLSWAEYDVQSPM